MKSEKAHRLRVAGCGFKEIGSQQPGDVANSLRSWSKNLDHKPTPFCKNLANLELSSLMFVDELIKLGKIINLLTHIAGSTYVPYTKL